MSHFTVLVSAKNDEDLEKKLLPFHEYECTGIEQYLEFVVEVPAAEIAIRANELRQEYYNDSDLSDLDILESWYGGELRSEGWGRVTNPNHKWDWWQIGGRWTGKLKLKEAGMGRNGLPGLMTNANTDPSRADIALAGDIDWQAIHDEDVQRQIDGYKLRHHYIALAEDMDIPEEIYLEAEKQFGENEYAQKVGSVRKLALYKMASQLAQKDGHLLFDSYDEIDQYLNLDEKQYKATCIGKAQTYAFIDLDGEWQQRGEMGWFGMDDTSKGTNNYDEAWWQFVKSIPEDQLVYVIDCHI